MKARTALWLWLLLMLLCGLAPAAAQDMITERATFEDKGADMTLEQVKLARFSRAEKVISRGYTRSALWIRLSVDAPADAGALLLYLLPAALDEVTLFSPASTGAVHARQVLQRTTSIDVRAGQTIHYLRIKTSGSMLLMPEILTQGQAHQAEIRRGIMLGAVLACCLPLLLGSLALIAVRREMLHVIFLCHLAASMFSLLGWFAYLQDDFGATPWFDINAAFHFSTIATIFTALLFFRALLARFGLPGWSKPLFSLFFISYMPLFVLFFALDRQLVLMLSTFLGGLGSALCLWLAVVALSRNKSCRWFIGTLIAALMLVALTALLIVHGAIAPGELMIHLIAFWAVFLAVFFGAILCLIDREQQDRIRTSVANETVLRQLAEHQKELGETRQCFMTMLMHEMKTPLSIIQLAAASLARHLPPGSSDLMRIRNITRSIEDLNALIERCVQADQIDQGAPLIDKQLFFLNSLTDDLLHSVDAARITLLAPAECGVFSDYQYVRIILVNLLSNALKYSAPNSMVEFNIHSAAHKGKEGLNFSISNSPGVAGMPDPEQVFVRYYRSEGARSCVGAGLGLWLAQAMAKQLGSEVHFEADCGAGQAQACFSFRLELA